MTAHPLAPLLTALREALRLAEEAFAAETSAGRRLDGPALAARQRAAIVRGLVVDVERQIGREWERLRNATQMDGGES